MDIFTRQLIKRFQADEDMVPACCRWNLRAMWCDARLRLFACPAEQRQILDWLETHASVLLNPRAGNFPPMLYRLPGEEAGAYLDRCQASATGKYWRNLNDDLTEATKWNQRIRNREK